MSSGIVAAPTRLSLMHFLAWPPLGCVKPPSVWNASARRHARGAGDFLSGVRPTTALLSAWMSGWTHPASPGVGRRSLLQWRAVLPVLVLSCCLDVFRSNTVRQTTRFSGALPFQLEQKQPNSSRQNGLLNSTKLAREIAGGVWGGGGGVATTLKIARARIFN